MTIQECYQTIGGNYEQLASRLPSAALIKKFIAKFPADGSYAELCAAMAKQDPEEAFRAVHTLKGVSANLSFDKLFDSLSQLTEVLRGQTGTMPAGAAALFAQVQENYDLTVRTIGAFLEQDA